MRMEFWCTDPHHPVWNCLAVLDSQRDVVLRIYYLSSLKCKVHIIVGNLK